MIDGNGSKVATFVDRYGDERTIHKTKNGLAVRHEIVTPSRAINGPIGALVGQRIKARRLALKMSQRDLAYACGMGDGHPKARIHAIESPAATRSKGIQLGTLYVIALALRCSPFDLLPSMADVIAASPIRKNHSPITRVTLEPK